MQQIFDSAQEQPTWFANLTDRVEETETRLNVLEAGLSEEVTPPLLDAQTRDIIEQMNAPLVERILALEEELADQKAAERKKKEDALNKTTFDVGGRIHYDYWGFSESSPGIGFFENPTATSPRFGVDPEDRWLFRRIRMEFEGDIQQTMSWRMQIDFGRTDEAAIKDVYVAFEELPFNQRLLVGHHKRPIGLDHWNSSRFNIFLERPLAVESFNSDSRRTGIAVRGHTDEMAFNWQYGFFQLENSSGDGVDLGDAIQNSINARISGTPWYDDSSDGRGYWHLGMACMLAQPDGDVGPASTNNNGARFRTRMSNRSSTRWLDTGAITGAEWYEIVAIESMLNIGALQLTTELMQTWVQRDASFPGSGADVTFPGFYAQASCFLTGEHIPINRRNGSIGRIKPFENFFLVERLDGGIGTSWGAWQIAARYDMLDLTDNDIKGGVGQNTTLALNWYWTSYSRLQLNVMYADIQDHRPVGGFDGGTALTVGMRFNADF